MLDHATRQKLTIFLSALLAALAYGGWAVFVNFEHGKSAWLMAGLVQASYAFLSTYSITKIAYYVYGKYPHGIEAIAKGFGASFIIMLIIPVTLHSIAGTPDILETILPGLIWGSIYLLAILVLHDKSLKKQNRT